MGNENRFDIEISLCDSIIVCSIEIFLIVLENCNDDTICNEALCLLERILIMNGEINEPYQWLTDSTSFFQTKYEKLKYLDINRFKLIFIGKIVTLIIRMKIIIMMMMR